MFDNFFDRDNCGVYDGFSYEAGFVIAFRYYLNGVLVDLVVGALVVESAAAHWKGFKIQSVERILWSAARGAPERVERSAWSGARGAQRVERSA